MTYFKEVDELVQIMGGYLKEASRLVGEGNKEMVAMQKAVMAMGVTIRLDMKNPAANMLLDYTKDPFDVVINNTSNTPVAVFTLDADIAHKFWHGKVNLAKALTIKQIVAKGPIPKILKLLPAIAPMYKLYPKYLDEIGRQELIVT